MQCWERAKAVLKGLGTLLLLGGVAFVLIAPSPLTRHAIFSSATIDGLSAWRGAVEYLSYLTEILLILFFGGFVFVQRFNRRLRAQLGSVADQTVKDLNQAIADAKGKVAKMDAYLRKLVSQGRLSGEEWRAVVVTMFSLQWMAQNPLHLFRATLWALAQMPGRLYGALAVLLVLLKIFAEIALILIAD